MICASPLCNEYQAPCELRSKPNSQYGLCPECRAIVARKALPIAGFIPSPALTLVARKVLSKFEPTRSEINEALKFARGSRYRSGDWDNRPVYRLMPLRHARAKSKLPHLLVGRRYMPTELSIVKSIVHTILAKEFIGTGHIYNRFLAGGTFMGRQGLAVPKGKKLEVLLGDSKSSKWTLTPSDIRLVGTHVLKSGIRLGFDFSDHDLCAFCCVAYQRALEAGDAKPPVAVPKYSMRTNYLGDHPFDHVFAPKSQVPARYRGKIRRASGLIEGVWPEGIEPNHQKPFEPKSSPSPIPDTDWIFQ